MQKIIFAHIALFMANTIYAINYIFAKDVMPAYIFPKGFIFLRVVVAACIFFIIHSLVVKERIKRQDLFYFFICALFGIVINMLCFFKGLSITTPINASLIMITTPLIVYSISCFLEKEERKHKRFLGVLLGLVGAALLITDGRFQFKLFDKNVGDLLIFLNATSYGIYLILVKPMMKKYHPLTVLKTIFLMGSIILFPIGWEEFSIINWATMPTNIILKTIFVVLFTTCIAYFFNIYAIGRLRASTVAFYIYLQPLLATTLSIILGKDILTIIKIVSACLIFSGVYFVIKRKSI